MKSVATIVFFLVTAIAASAWSQGDQAAKGKAIAETKKCAICHKEGGLAKPMEKLVGTNTDEFLKAAISDPKKTLGPQTRMPPVKLSDEEAQDVVAYLRSIAKQ